jgi:putative DNA primase/helicase
MLTLTDSGVTEVTGVQPSVYAGSGVTPTGGDGVTGVTDGGAEGIAAPEAKAQSHLVPGETERPKFVVIDDWHEEGGNKFKPGVWHFGMKAGRGDAPPTLTQKWICSPLHLDAVTTDSHGGNFGRLLRIKSTLGKWSTWAMPMNMLRGDCSDLRG